MAFEYAVVLTGGIATGKSTVAKIFVSFEFEIIDADKIAHLMLDRQHEKIVELFGEIYVIDKKVNRKLLGSLIFAEEEEKARLEALLHPLIFAEIEKESILLDKKSKPYLVDIPLFFETKRYPIKKSIVVYVPQKLQLQRLMERDNSTQEMAQQRIDSQMDIEEKRQKATYLIDNQGDLNALQELCVKVKDTIIQDYREN